MRVNQLTYKTNKPNSWKILPLKYLGKIDNSGIWGKDKKFNDSIEVKIPTTKNISSDGHFDLNGMEKRFISLKDYESYICKKGDVIIVKSSGSSENVVSGKCGYVNSDNQFSFSNFLMRFKPDVKKVIPKFIYYFLRSHITRERVLRMVSSTTYPNLKVDEYISSKIPIPSITEQKRIVSFLDKKNDQFNSLIEKIEKKINLLKEKKNSLLHLYFTKGIDPNVEIKKTNFKWIGNIPKHWKISKVAYLAKDLVSGPFGSSLTKDIYVKDGFKVYGQEQVIKDDFSFGDYYVNEKKFKELKRCQIKPNDILISCVGTFGKISMVPLDVKPGIINPRLLKLTPNSKIDPEFFLELLRSPSSLMQFNFLSRGGTMGVINIEILNQLVFPLPPINEQLKIKKRVLKEKKNLDNLIKKYEEKNILTREFFKSFNEHVISGKYKF